MNPLIIPSGTHILANWYECDFSLIEKIGMEGMKNFISEIIKKYGLTEVGNCYHSFGKNAFTGVAILAESHISIHTWPEIGFVTMDIYVCNLSRDNSTAAKGIYEELEGIMKPGKIKVDSIIR